MIWSSNLIKILQILFFCINLTNSTHVANPHFLQRDVLVHECKQTLLYASRILGPISYTCNTTTKIECECISIYISHCNWRSYQSKISGNEDVMSSINPLEYCINLLSAVTLMTSEIVRMCGLLLVSDICVSM